MALITWNNNYSVNIKEIDSQHKKLVDLVNELYDNMKIGKGKEVTGKVLNDLVKYTESHFAYEEELFKKFKYIEGVKHSQEHAQLLSKVKSFVKDFDSGKGSVSVELLNFLKDWLVSHIGNSDKKYSQFLNSKGVS